MFKIVERDWLMKLRGTVYRFDETNYYKRMKQNNDGKCLFFYNTMKNCNVKINDNIFFPRWTVSFNGSVKLKQSTENPSVYVLGNKYPGTQGKQYLL